jgi:CheY-like chemotaxis protein
MFKGLVTDADCAYVAEVPATGLVAVLIVSDDPIARSVYAELFALRGYAVATASGPRQGLLRLARNRKIAVVVLDVSSGTLRLLQRVRTMRPDLRVHVSSFLPPCDYMTRAPSESLH